MSEAQYLECRTRRLDMKERVDVLEERKSKATGITRSLAHRLKRSEEDFQQRQRVSESESVWVCERERVCG